MRSIAVVGVMMLAVVVASTAAQNSPPPSSQPVATLTPQQLAGIQWHFNSFLNGTAAQLRDEINSPLESQLARKAIKTQHLADLKASITGQRDGVASRLRKTSADFASLQDNLANAKMRLTNIQNATGMTDAAKAKNISNAQDRIDRIQGQINRRIDAGSKDDPVVAGLIKQSITTEAELHDLDAAIGRASKARDQLLDGLRLGRRIPGPAATGGTGVLGRITPTKIIDGQSFEADFVLLQITGKDHSVKTPDGFTAVKTIPFPVHLRVSGIDTGSMRENTETILDRIVQITGTKDTDDGTVYLVNPPVNPTEAMQGCDYLFDKLDTLRSVPATAPSTNPIPF